MTMSISHEHVFKEWLLKQQSLLNVGAESGILWQIWTYIRNSRFDYHQTLHFNVNQLNLLL